MPITDYTESAQQALTLLVKYSVTEPIVNVFDMAHREGLHIRFVKMPEQLEQAAGFLDRKNKLIYVNADEAPSRQLFTVAHELGHFLLGHHPEKVLYRWPVIQNNDPVESSANCFAANLLVPETMLVEVMDKYHLQKNAVGLLAKIFGVSREVIHFRLKRIG